VAILDHYGNMPTNLVEHEQADNYGIVVEGKAATISNLWCPPHNNDKDKTKHQPNWVSVQEEVQWPRTSSEAATV